jgi:hypothetical protein
MAIDAQEVLAVLDGCCDNFSFPMLDNGYVYLAASRMSLYRASEDWAIVIEIFGYSPRAWLPDTAICTFASTVCNRDIPKTYGPQEVSNFLTFNPNNDFRAVYPIEAGDWQDDHDHLISEQAGDLVVRGEKHSIPDHLGEYAKRGITIERHPRVQVFELCRYLADVARDSVLGTSTERRLSVLPGMAQILQLEEWRHPNVVDREERRSRSETFQQLAKVLATGNTEQYQPSQSPNTHWRNWPAGGTL